MTGSDPQRPPIPLTVVGGYLGAGKTTLINELLREPGGRRYGVVVNDIGEVAIDAALIESIDDDTVTLSNGCVCCSLVDGFAEALDELADPARQLDHVVVEVSGVGDPWKVAQWGRTPGFELDAVLVLADAETVRARADDRYVGETVRQQLAGGDLVVVTRVDTVDAAGVAAAVSWLSGVTEAPVLVADRGARSLAALIDAARPGAGREVDGAHADHVVRVLESPPSRLRAAWTEWLAAAPRDVVRVKGVVDAGTDGWLQLQRAGRRHEVTRWRAASPGRSAVVVIASPAVEEAELDAWVGRI